jgi:hypothetical protein
VSLILLIQTKEAHLVSSALPTRVVSVIIWSSFMILSTFTDKMPSFHLMRNLGAQWLKFDDRMETLLS